jgi:mono/diheme cytochrome c family protein
MKWKPKWIVLAIMPLLMAALGMEDQPSFRPHEAPVLAPPATAVPTTGKEIVTWGSTLKSTVPPSKESVTRGELLFTINCRMCHGHKAGEPGPVGRHLTPPPPSPYQDRIQSLSDEDIFKRITFGFGRMPPFQTKLIPRERWDIVNFLRTLKQHRVTVL